MRSPRLYFAGPLFTQAERDWNAAIVDILRHTAYRVDLPQEQAAAILPPGAVLSKAVVGRLFEVAVKSIRRADAVVAVLDGPDPDSGTCFECGYAVAIGKPILGIRTDLRLGGDDPTRGVNLMLSEGCDRFIWLGLRALGKDSSYSARQILSALGKMGI